MRALIFCGLFVATVAGAQDITIDSKPEAIGQTWSAVGPRTVTPGANMVEASVGYPGVSVSYLRGIVSGLNLGARAAFVYGVEGMLRDVAPGFKVQGLLKFRIFDGDQVSLGVTFEPGVLTHSSFIQGTRVGLALPVGLRLGIAASSALAVAVLVDVPVWVQLGTYDGWNLPILTGGGVEYFVTSQVVAFFRARIGPTLRSGRPTEVTFESSLGVGYRW